MPGRIDVFKIRRHLWLALVCFLALSAANAANVEAAERMTVRVGVDMDFEPYNFADKLGQADGFSIDVLKAIARNTNLRIEVVFGKWARLRQQVETGQLDMLSTMAKSPEREKLIDFSDTMIVSYDSIFVRGDAYGAPSPVRAEADLRGKRVIVQAGDLAEDYLGNSKIPLELIHADSIPDAFKLLMLNQGDAVVASQIVGLFALNKLEVNRKIVLAKEPHFGPYKREYSFAVKKNDRELVNRLNAGLSAITASGELKQLEEKWFSNLDPEAHVKSTRQRQLIVSLLLAIFVAFIATGFVLFFRIEVRRKSQSLRESEARFRGLVENLPGVVFRAVKTDKWHMDYLSDAIERISGYPAADFTEGRRKFLTILHPEDQATIQQRGQQSVQARFEFDFRIVTKAGETRWLHARGGTLNASNDDVIRVEGIFLDVTEQKRVADLLTQQQTRMASSARLSALGEMAGGIAHEINNPLAIINLRTHQLQVLASKGPVAPVDVVTIATGIESTAVRISKIVKSLQTVARESEHDPFETVPLKAIIGDAFELCFQRMRKHGIEVQVDAISDDLEIECRRVQISQVLINLLNNAFDAVVLLPLRYVRISARDLREKDRDWIEISIVDSGKGLSTEMAQKVFQPFFTTKGVGKGTGLGLSISKGMIEAHDGHISVDTAFPTTRFVIVLPKFQAANQEHFALPHEQRGADRNIHHENSPTL